MVNNFRLIVEIEFGRVGPRILLHCTNELHICFAQENVVAATFAVF